MILVRNFFSITKTTKVYEFISFRILFLVLFLIPILRKSFFIYITRNFIHFFTINSILFLHLWLRNNLVLFKALTKINTLLQILKYNAFYGYPRGLSEQFPNAFEQFQTTFIKTSTNFYKFICQLNELFL